jgi:hypothetical protein
MIAALRKLFTPREYPPREAEIARLKAEIATLSEEWNEAVAQHRHRAHLAAKLQDKRHALLRLQRGF